MFPCPLQVRVLSADRCEGDLGVPRSLLAVGSGTGKPLEKPQGTRRRRPSYSPIALGDGDPGVALTLDLQIGLLPDSLAHLPDLFSFFPWPEAFLGASSFPRGQSGGGGGVWLGGHLGGMGGLPLCCCPDPASIEPSCPGVCDWALPVAENECSGAPGGFGQGWGKALGLLVPFPRALSRSFRVWAALVWGTGWPTGQQGQARSYSLSGKPEESPGAPYPRVVMVSLLELSVMQTAHCCTRAIGSPPLSKGANEAQFEVGPSVGSIYPFVPLLSPRPCLSYSRTVF